LLRGLDQGSICAHADSPRCSPSGRHGTGKFQRCDGPIELKDGTRLEGRVVFEDDRTLILRTGEDERELRMTEVALRALRASEAYRLRSTSILREPPLHDWQWLALSSFCEARGLAGEAEVCALGALVKNPAPPSAHRLLHHERAGSGWQFRQGDRWLPFVIDAQPRRWSDAWLLDTTHYALRTNLPLQIAVRRALELELFYRSFMIYFGKPLQLREVLTPLAFQMHGDRGSYPEITRADAAPTSTASSAASLINADGGVVRGLVFPRGHAPAPRRSCGNTSPHGWTRACGVLRLAVGERGGARARVPERDPQVSTSPPCAKAEKPYSSKSCSP
jgi:hypothetical protein